MCPAGLGWSFLPAYIDGDDIVARGVKSTRFGGTDDGEDNGQGAGGFSVRSHPEYLGVSLPQRGRGIRSMADCPIPKLPLTNIQGQGGQVVKVYSPTTGKSVYAHLVDIGPSKKTGHGLDCMNSVIKALGLDLKAGVYTLDFRIIGAAKMVGK